MSPIDPEPARVIEYARPEPTHSILSPLSIQLAAMMFVEFAIWGSWAVFISKHMLNLGFNQEQIGYVYLTTAIGAMLSPLIAGWVADRFMPNQLFTGMVHLVGAGVLVIAWQQATFPGLFTWMLVYSVLYMPTIALTNAIAFHHMRDSKQFGAVRVWGTIGWIAINFAFSEYLGYWERVSPGVSHIGDCLALAAILSALMGAYCFTLPNTPPSRAARNPYAFLEAIRLTANRNFAVLLAISFVVAIELPFYYNLTYNFLTDAKTGVGLAESTAGKATVLGQVAEVALMLLLAPAIRRLGMRTTIVLGILAWPLRYAIFAIGQPAWLVIAAQCLHGICYAFFFVAGMIAVERLSRRDIRASAQGLIVFATNGVGMLIGSLLAGRVAGYFTLPDGGYRWAMIFLVPIVITVVAAAVFAAMFSEREYQADSERIAREEGGTV